MKSLVQIVVAIHLSLFWANSQENKKNGIQHISGFKTLELDVDVQETSGLAFDKNYILTHNDDKDNNIYYINTSTGKIEKKVTIPGYSPIDWEELQVDSNYYYIGDIGNNYSGNRINLQIIKVSKKNFQKEIIQFSYPTQTDLSPSKPNTTNFDCEAFLVTDSLIYLFSKEWSNDQTSIYSIPNKAGNHTVKLLATLPTKGLITGASFSTNKKTIALVGYTKLLRPFLMLFTNFESDAFLTGKQHFYWIQESFLQVEGVTFLDEKTLVISNEQFKKAWIKKSPKLTFINLGDSIK